jgi:hypothetical protein
VFLILYINLLLNCVCTPQKNNNKPQFYYPTQTGSIYHKQAPYITNTKIYMHRKLVVSLFVCRLRSRYDASILMIVYKDKQTPKTNPKFVTDRIHNTKGLRIDTR